ncbi:DUF1414 domain-containing protein [Neptunicella marina]|uniref:UPF0352 protein H8B19_01865 n=1 Tax=Neptunicella marina TaxID=2125989 RepID=A0A8J6IS62_9ALTE|nr:DUF1414 domain-containing protein [Neptunicella marina]MBC3764606.1 DUF1414 domain-containing protein [Neptunicella marina]
MPQQSKYTDSQFTALTHDIIDVLEKHQANRDLSLMVLGNILTNIFQHQVKPDNREQMVAQFTQVLIKSVKASQ